MKINVLLCVLLSIALVFNSCKKTVEPINPDAIPKIQKITEYKNGLISSFTSYEYDTNGRISKITHSDSSYEIYIYSPDSIIKNIYQANGKIASLISRLNKNGLIFNEGNGAEYEYDLLGFKTSWIISDADTHYDYKVSNGNTIEMSNTYYSAQSAANKEIYTYKFLPNSTNTIGNENIGITFYGKQNKNLVEVTSHILQDAFRKNNSSYSYSYEYDNKKRVTKRILTGIGILEGRYTLYTYYD